MTISVVLADANIRFSRTLRNYILYAADARAIEVHWSQQTWTRCRGTSELALASIQPTPRVLAT